MGGGRKSKFKFCEISILQNKEEYIIQNRINPMYKLKNDKNICVII